MRRSENGAGEKKQWQTYYSSYGTEFQAWIEHEHFPNVSFVRAGWQVS